MSALRELLVIWTARTINPALQHLHALNAEAKLWVHGHTETEIAAIIDQVAHSTHPSVEGRITSDTLITLIPDDAIVSQHAYDTVLATARQHPEHAASGWANIDFTRPLGTVMTEPVPEELIDDWYTLWDIPRIASHPGPIAATWTGMSLHTMPAWMWQENPIRPHYSPPGSASDHALAVSLARNGRRIYVDPSAALMHLKVDHTLTDTQDPWKRLNLAHKSVGLA